MRERPRLFCLDPVLVDVVLDVSALPPSGGDVRATSLLVTTGGGFNAMSAAARHAMSVAHAGRLGAGPFAALARSELEGAGVELVMGENTRVDTGICLVLVEPGGERTFVTSAGAETTVRASDLEALDLRDGDYVLLSGYNVMDSRDADVVVKWLSTLPLGVIVVFDPATRVHDIASGALTAVLARTQWLVCNETEARYLLAGSDQSDLAGALATRAAVNVVVRVGPRGCWVALAGGPGVAVAGFASSAVDTNGAGDVHNGVFIAELARGEDCWGAARWANAAAAISIARSGPATCPTRDEVATWLEGESPSG